MKGNDIMTHNEIIHYSLETIEEITGIIPEFCGDIRNNMGYKDKGFLEETYKVYNYNNNDCNVYITFNKENVKIVFTTWNMWSDTVYSEVLPVDDTLDSFKSVIKLYFKKFDCLNNCWHL